MGKFLDVMKRRDMRIGEIYILAKCQMDVDRIPRRKEEIDKQAEAETLELVKGCVVFDCAGCKKEWNDNKCAGCAAVEYCNNYFTMQNLDKLKKEE